MRLLGWLVAVALAMTANGSVAQAGVDMGADWIDTTLTSPTTRLFTPSSGALLALTADGLMRSDDAGDNWYAAAPDRNVVYVDPSDHDTLYATSQVEPLSRSSDGGTTWTSLMSGPPFAGKALDGVAQSQANPNLLYAGLKLPGISDEYWLYRSVNAGMAWTEAFHSHNSLCGWGAEILLPHPTDPNRLIFAGGCHAGRDFFEIVQQSVDQGQTFTEWYANRLARTDAPAGFPKALVGGHGADAGRWYLALNRDQRLGGSVLLSSDDDGANWDTVLDYQGGGTFDVERSTFSVSVAGVAYDPDNPETVYVARNAAYLVSPPIPVTSGVTVSTDAGQTWNDLGNQQQGMVADVALGIDARWLFLATDRGVARLALQ